MIIWCEFAASHSAIDEDSRPVGYNTLYIFNYTPIYTASYPRILDFYSFLSFRVRSQWPRGLRRGSAAVRFLRLWVRIPPRAWISVCCECCVLSGRGLGVGLITRPEESYRAWCVCVRVIVKPRMRRPWSTRGCFAIGKKYPLGPSFYGWYRHR
jgi:hypothetical protein